MPAPALTGTGIREAAKSQDGIRQMSHLFARTFLTGFVTVIRQSVLFASVNLVCMRQDPTFKDIFAYGFMVEELLRWFVAGLPGEHELVETCDFSNSFACRNSPRQARPREDAPTPTTSLGGYRSVTVRQTMRRSGGCI